MKVFLNLYLIIWEEDDLLVLFSDTPPMFAGKIRIHFEDTIDIYFIKKI